MYEVHRVNPRLGNIVNQWKDRDFKSITKRLDWHFHCDNINLDDHFYAKPFNNLGKTIYFKGDATIISEEDFNNYLQELRIKITLGVN